MREVVLGLLIGALLGLLGAGGSVLAVPALVFGAGQPLSSAVPLSLLVVGVASATAALPRIRLRQVRWRIAGVVGVTGAAAAIAGAALNRALPSDLVLIGFAVLLTAAGLGMLRPDHEVGGDCALPDGQVDWRGCLPKSAGVGAAVGLLTGLFGVGGGFLLVPALTLLLGLPLTVATGTSLLIITVTSTAGLAAHTGAADLDIPTTVLFTGAAVLASLVAGRLATRLPADRLRQAFGWLVLAVAAYVTGRVLLG